MLKFHLDENVDTAVADGLKSRGFDCTTSDEAALLHADDSTQLAYCLRENRVMISHDADMLRLARSGVQHSGLAWCKMHSRSIKQIILSCEFLNRNTTSDEMQNRVEFIHK